MTTTDPSVAALRQRVEDAIMPNHHDPNAEAESYDVLAVFAEWLQEEARRWPSGMTAYLQPGDEIRALANGIERELRP